MTFSYESDVSDTLSESHVQSMHYLHFHPSNVAATIEINRYSTNRTAERMHPTRSCLASRFFLYVVAIISFPFLSLMAITVTNPSSISSVLMSRSAIRTAACKDNLALENNWKTAIWARALFLTTSLTKSWCCLCCLFFLGTAHPILPLGCYWRVH